MPERAERRLDTWGWIALSVATTTALIALLALILQWKSHRDTGIDRRIKAIIGDRILSILELEDRARGLLNDAMSTNTKAETLRDELAARSTEASGQVELILTQHQAAKETVDGLVDLLRENTGWLEVDLRVIESTLVSLNEEILEIRMSAPLDARDDQIRQRTLHRKQNEVAALEAKRGEVKSRLAELEGRLKSVSELRVHRATSWAVQSQTATADASVKPAK